MDHYGLLLQVPFKKVPFKKVPFEKGMPKLYFMLTYVNLC